MMLREEALIRRAQEVASREGQAVQELSGQFTAGLLPVVETLLNCTGHVLVTGAGTSRAVAQRFAHLLACCGTPALFIHAADALHGGAGAIKAGDVGHIISQGGQNLENNQFAEIPLQRGARVVPPPGQAPHPRAAARSRRPAGPWLATMRAAATSPARGSPPIIASAIMPEPTVAIVRSESGDISGGVYGSPLDADRVSGRKAGLMPARLPSRDAQIAARPRRKKRALVSTAPSSNPWWRRAASSSPGA